MLSDNGVLFVAVAQIAKGAFVQSAEIFGGIDK
jgi:hypothetical protein